MSATDPTQTLEIKLQGSELINRHLVMNFDLSIASRLFGGRLVAWLDEATAISAARIIGHLNIVTAKISEIVFESPAFQGDLVEIYAKPVRRGRSSLTIEGIAVVRREGRLSSEPRLLASCTFVFVSVDRDGKSIVWNTSGE